MESTCIESPAATRAHDLTVSYPGKVELLRRLARDQRRNLRWPLLLEFEREAPAARAFASLTMMDLSPEQAFTLAKTWLAHSMAYGMELSVHEGHEIPGWVCTLTAREAA